MLNQSSWFIRISSAHVDLIRNLMIHFTSRQIVSDLVQSCHQITLSHFKTHRTNCHFYESFHFMTIHSTCVVFLVVTAAHRFCSLSVSASRSQRNKFLGVKLNKIIDHITFHETCVDSSITVVCMIHLKDYGNFI